MFVVDQRPQLHHGYQKIAFISLKMHILFIRQIHPWRCVTLWKKDSQELVSFLEAFYLYLRLLSL